jgi:hypothetical protein
MFGIAGHQRPGVNERASGLLMGQLAAAQALGGRDGAEDLLAWREGTPAGGGGQHGRRREAGA